MHSTFKGREHIFLGQSASFLQCILAAMSNKNKLFLLIGNNLESIWYERQFKIGVKKWLTTVGYNNK